MGISARDLLRELPPQAILLQGVQRHDLRQIDEVLRDEFLMQEVFVMILQHSKVCLYLRLRYECQFRNLYERVQ